MNWTIRLQWWTRFPGCDQFLYSKNGNGTASTVKSQDALIQDQLEIIMEQLPNTLRYLSSSRNFRYPISERLGLRNRLNLIPKRQLFAPAASRHRRPASPRGQEAVAADGLVSQAVTCKQGQKWFKMNAGEPCFSAGFVKNAKFQFLIFSVHVWKMAKCTDLRQISAISSNSNKILFARR